MGIFGKKVKTLDVEKPETLTGIVTALNNIMAKQIRGENDETVTRDDIISMFETTISEDLEEASITASKEATRDEEIFTFEKTTSKDSEEAPKSEEVEEAPKDEKAEEAVEVEKAEEAPKDERVEEVEEALKTEEFEETKEALEADEVEEALVLDDEKKVEPTSDSEEPDNEETTEEINPEAVSGATDALKNDLEAKVKELESKEEPVAEVKADTNDEDLAAFADFEDVEDTIPEEIKEETPSENSEPAPVEEEEKPASENEKSLEKNEGTDSEEKSEEAPTEEAEKAEEVEQSANIEEDSKEEATEKEEEVENTSETVEESAVEEKPEISEEEKVEETADSEENSTANAEEAISSTKRKLKVAKINTVKIGSTEPHKCVFDLNKNNEANAESAENASDMYGTSDNSAIEDDISSKDSTNFNSCEENDDMNKTEFIEKRTAEVMSGAMPSILEDEDKTLDNISSDELKAYLKKIGLLGAINKMMTEQHEADDSVFAATASLRKLTNDYNDTQALVVTRFDADGYDITEYVTTEHTPEQMRIIGDAIKNGESVEHITNPKLSCKQMLCLLELQKSFDISEIADERFHPFTMKAYCNGTKLGLTMTKTLQAMTATGAEQYKYIQKAIELMLEGMEDDAVAELVTDYDAMCKKLEEIQADYLAMDYKISDNGTELVEVKGSSDNSVVEEDEDPVMEDEDTAKPATINAGSYEYSNAAGVANDEG